MLGQRGEHRSECCVCFQRRGNVFLSCQDNSRAEVEKDNFVKLCETNKVCKVVEDKKEATNTRVKSKN